MAPKGKKGKGKTGGDDWDEGLGETVDPIAQVEAEAKAADNADDAGEDDGAAGGGFMAMLAKNREKRKKKGKKVDPNDFLDGEDPPPQEDGAAAEPEPAVDLAAKAPVEANMEDEDLFDAPAKGKKGGKGGKHQAAKAQVAEVEPAASAVDEEDDDGEETGGKVKTKAEKEREKKEREKARKKEQAASKKKTIPAAAKEEAKAVVAAPVAAEETAPAAGGKKKKLNPALAALQKQQEDLRRQQEEEARSAAEAKAREDEEIRRAEEEEQHLAEQKAAKKAKEKAKVEQQKREGTYKTEKQRKDEAQKKLRLNQMLDAGAKVAALSEGAAEDSEGTAKKDKKVGVKRKDPRKEAAERKAQQEEEEAARKKMEELKLVEEQTRLAEEEAEKAKADAEAKKGEESEEEDWEAMMEKEEAGSEDEEEEDAVIVAKAPNGKPVQAGAAGAKALIKPSNGKAAEDSNSEEDSDDDSSSEDEQQSATARQAALRRQQASDKRKAEVEAARNAASTENLRSPICCILGHVDTGKTKLLDKIRQTNVQEGEAGGITQQIGATYFPVEALRKKTAVVNPDGAFEFRVPGLLVIDTPGHESFTNLRSRGSSLCNIAILVVDIMHGLEPQTLESMRLLRDRKTPFIVALNKIDRLYGWKAVANNGFRESFNLQNKAVQNEFRDRLEKTKLAFAEQGFNAELFYENKSMAKYVSLVPTSAHTGEGIPDMLKLLVTLTQERMTRQLMYLSEVECTVLEVKVIEGLGTTIDVVLSNGILHEGDTIVLCGTDGAITTQVRALLTPAEMKELRVKSVYVHNKTVKAALGVKITANGLDNAIAGSRLLVAKNKDDEDEIEELEEDVMGDLENLMSRISRTGRGVTVQASTL
ncbi:eukaryotic translation initiation factor 5B, partial [Teratosphaeriaceae sp. CCFEE 6253]